MSKMNIIQHTYTPKFTGYSNTLILDNLFKTESCAEYALQHNFDVILTMTTSTSTGAAIAVFLSAGFKIELSEKNCIAPDGTTLPQDIQFLFIHPEH